MSNRILFCKANYRAGILNTQSATAVASECSTEVRKSAQSIVVKFSTTSLYLKMFWIGIFSRSLKHQMFSSRIRFLF